MTKIVVSGFGGQGVLTLGALMANIALNQNKEVTWMPSYGAEMRGGTANCSVIVSDKMIGSPIATAGMDVLCAMNAPSVTKFIDKVFPGGFVFINSSIVTEKIERSDVKVVSIDASNIASKVGDLRVANMVMLSGFLVHTDLFTFDDVKEVLDQKFKGGRNEKLIPLNIEAIKQGMEACK